MMIKKPYSVWLKESSPSIEEEVWAYDFPDAAGDFVRKTLPAADHAHEKEVQVVVRSEEHFNTATYIVTIKRDWVYHAIQPYLREPRKADEQWKADE